MSRAQPPWSIARARRCSVAAGVRRFVAYLSERQGSPEPHVDAAAASEYLTHLAVRCQVSASTQNEALCAILFDYHVAWYAPSGSMLTIPRTRRANGAPSRSALALSASPDGPKVRASSARAGQHPRCRDDGPRRRGGKRAGGQAAGARRAAICGAHHSGSRAPWRASKPEVLSHGCQKRPLPQPMDGSGGKGDNRRK